MLLSVRDIKKDIIALTTHRHTDTLNVCVCVFNCRIQNCVLWDCKWYNVIVFASLEEDGDS